MATYTVIGTFGDELEHEYGEYDSIDSARRVMSWHSNTDEVRIIDTDTRETISD